MEKRTDYSAPNLVCICVDQKIGQEIAGRIYHGADEAAVHFSSAAHMILEIDRLFDRMGYPQCSVVSRTFSDIQSDVKTKEAVISMSKPDVIINNSGEEATFVVHVKYRQNATWQGTVTWAEENKQCNFRSALELLKLIDSAMDEKEKEKGNKE